MRECVFEQMRDSRACQQLASEFEVVLEPREPMEMTTDSPSKSSQESLRKATVGDLVYVG